MNQAINLGIVKLILPLVFGILIANHFVFSVRTTLFYCLASTLIFSLAFFLTWLKKRKIFFFSLSTFLVFIGLGLLSVSLQDERNQRDHYLNQGVTDESVKREIVFTVVEVLKPNNYFNTYVIELNSIDQKAVSGKVHLSIEKDSTHSKLKVDDKIWAKGYIKTLLKPLNPNQFDYGKYLSRKQIYGQTTLSNEGLYYLNTKKHTLKGWAAYLRNLIDDCLNRDALSNEAKAMINALVLGQRQDLSKETFQDYSQAGVIHLLAISGLHIGLILKGLEWFFSGFGRYRKNRLSAVILIAISLWSYALLTGFSASVTRAVAMFSFLSIAEQIKKKKSSMNNLLASFFFLILWNPNFIFEVGFQLSYLAVFFIIWLYPFVSQFAKTKFKIFNQLWKLISVTLVAQIGVLPLSLYYFHQFPGLFLLSNLVLIPLISYLLGFGFLIVFLSLSGLVPNFLIVGYDFVLNSMNSFVHIVAQQKAFLFQDIPFSLPLLPSSYLCLFMILISLKELNYKHLRRSLISVSLFLIILITTEYQKASINEFVIFNKSRETVIGVKKAKKLLLFSGDKTIGNSAMVRDYKGGRWIEEVESTPSLPVYRVNEKHLLVIDSLGIYKTSLKPEIVLLTHSPKINLNRLIDQLKPKRIIADASNYRSYQERWRISCQKKGIPYHQTNRDGALILK